MHLFTKHTSLVTNEGIKYGTQFLTTIHTWFQQFFDVFLPHICLQGFTAVTINIAVFSVLTIFQRHAVTNFRVEETGPKVI